MHRLVLIAAIAAALAAPVSAQEVPALDLTEVCKPGCIVLIKFDESARFGADSDFAGQFTLSASNNPMIYFAGMAVTETGQTIYQLSGEPGTPMFRNIELLKEFMADQDEKVSGAPAS